MGSICTCASRRAEGASLFFQYLETKAYKQLEAVALTSVKPRKWRLLWVRRTPSCVKSDLCKNKVQIKNSNRPVAINDMRSRWYCLVPRKFAPMITNDSYSESAWYAAWLGCQLSWGSSFCSSVPPNECCDSTLNEAISISCTCSPTHSTLTSNHSTLYNLNYWQRRKMKHVIRRVDCCLVSG